ncbi:allantoate permease protein [Apiospora saccharicola]
MAQEKSDNFIAPLTVPDADGDIDVAALYANHFTDGGEMYSHQDEQRLRWKLDLRLVPLLWFNVTLGAMDKVTTATAALYNFRADTGLDGDKYSWVGSAFCVGIGHHPRELCLISRFHRLVCGLLHLREPEERPNRRGGRGESPYGYGLQGSHG